MKLSKLKHIIKESIKEFKDIDKLYGEPQTENQLLLEYPTITLQGATDWCADNCWPSLSCNISAVTFVFGDGSTQEGYDSVCGEGKTRGPITAPQTLNKRR